jgi:phosphoribosylformylglycinamidine cyclo-ligase
VGIAENSKIIDGSEIRPGHRLIGIASSGLHSNGFSLVRKICFDLLKLEIDAYIPELEQPLGQVLLTPTRIYSGMIQLLIRDLPIHGFAHITGGGITDNIIRIIPEGCGIVVYRNSWEIPPIFEFLRKAGNVPEDEMMRTFNNGVGLVAVAPEKSVSDVTERLRGMGETAFVIGQVVKRESDVRVTYSDTDGTC